MTTEGDSLPSLARGGGEWLGAVVCPLWGRRLREGEPVRGRAKPAPAQPLGD